MGPLYAGHVLVVVAADVEFEGLLRLKVIDEHIHHAVVLASLGVFVGVVFGIELAPHLHGVLLHLALVETVEGNTFAVGRPIKALGDGKLLFVHPVGGAVDNLVELAVEGHLGFFQRIEGHHIEVVVADKSHHLSIG